MSVWSIDNLWMLGEIRPGWYVILKDGHEICRGTDPMEMLRMVDTLNAAEDRKEEDHGQAA